MSPSAGTRVTPNVELVRPLGEGGMGKVWVARHLGLDAEVAVKFVSADFDDASAAERFKREAALSAKIKSPHVVKTFDYGLTDGVPYIVMELLAGETLGDRLARVERLVPRDVSLIVSQTAQVLEEAHALGVVHRDIKPDNIFLVEAGYELFVKVLDFGIAKQTTKLGVASVTDTGAIVGTPEYMAPEQLLSPKAADWRADMWAVAVLAYRALVGVVPFKGETLPSLSLAICNAQFTPPSEIVSGLPVGVDDWFMRAFAPEPKDRFESDTEMAHALGELLRDSTADLEPTTSAPRSSTPPKEDGGTLASAMSEAMPAVGPKPRIVVEEAADDPHAKTVDAEGDGPGLLDEEPSESSRRRGPVVIEIERARSTARPTSLEREVPSTMRFDEASEKRYGRLKIAGALLAGVLVVAAADLLLRGPGELPKPQVAASTEASSTDELWTEDTAVVPPAPRPEHSPAPSPQPEPSAAPELSNEPEPPPAPVAVAHPPPPVHTPQPTAAPTAAPSVDPCASPYIVQKDGTFKIKPGCVNR
jgi:serine/threonine protein kinase